MHPVHQAPLVSTALSFVSLFFKLTYAELLLLPSQPQVGDPVIVVCNVWS